MKKEELKSLMDENKISIKELAERTGYTVATILSYRCGARDIIPRAALSIVKSINEINIEREKE